MSAHILSERVHRPSLRRTPGKGIAFGENPLRGQMYMLDALRVQQPDYSIVQGGNVHVYDALGAEAHLC